MKHIPYNFAVSTACVMNQEIVNSYVKMMSKNTKLPKHEWMFVFDGILFYGFGYDKKTDTAKIAAFKIRCSLELEPILVQVLMDYYKQSPASLGQYYVEAAVIEDILLIFYQSPYHSRLMADFLKFEGFTEMEIKLFMKDYLMFNDAQIIKWYEQPNEFTIFTNKHRIERKFNKITQTIPIAKNVMENMQVLVHFHGHFDKKCKETWTKCGNYWFRYENYKLLYTV